MASLCSESRGATRARTACSTSLVFAAATLKKTALTRFKIRPDRSIASSVLAKVGGAGSSAMAIISARPRFMPSAKAGS